MVMRTRPFSDDLFQHIHPNHQVLLSCKSHRPGYHQWRQMQQGMCELSATFDAQYYRNDPEDIYELSDYTMSMRRSWRNQMTL